MRITTWLVSATLAAAASVPALGAEGIFLNAMPPGQNGNSAGGVGVPQMVPTIAPKNFLDQLALYGDLAYAQEALTDTPCTPPTQASEHVAQSDQVCNYYKHEGLDPDVVVSEKTLTTPDGKTVTIRRDRWGVPFVDGEDRAAAMFGFGYASAQDRLWLHDLLRTVGRGRMSEFLGPAGDTYGFDSDIASVAGYSEDELDAMVENAHAKFGTLGDQIVADVDNMVAGINAYLKFLNAHLLQRPPEYTTIALDVPPSLDLKYPPRPWTRNDIVASAILIQSIFANGGGGEHMNVLLLQRLAPEFGPGSTYIPKAACDFWRDVRHASDPATPLTIGRSFATQSPARISEDCPQALPAGAAIFDPGSLQSRLIFATGDAAAAASASAALLSLNGPAALTRLPDFGKAATIRAPLRDAAGTRQVYASLDPVKGAREALARAGFPMPATMSNFIGVNADQTRDGHPIVVMGPQASYFLPQLLWEVAVKSRGGTPLDFAARGIVFGDLPYINIGRGSKYAWSATSGGSDLVDIRVSKLCNVDGTPASREDADGDGFLDADGYLFDQKDGQGMVCRRLYRRTDEWQAHPTVASVALGGPGTTQAVKRYILRTHYGPVFATATVNGAPVALSRQRSTFFGELETAPPFALASTRLMTGPGAFKRIFNSVTGTFNWLYADADHIAYLHSGLFPVRHARAHPELPVWGDGRFEWASMRDLPAKFFERFGGDAAEGGVGFPNRATPIAQGDPLKGYFEWQGFLPLDAHPNAVDPETGLIANWNSKPAAGWWAADHNGSFGPIHRANMLQDRLEAFQASGRKHTVATMAEIAADAAFTDLRGMKVVPLLVRVMRSSTLDQEHRDLARLMQDWADAGSRRWIDGGKGLGGYRRDRDHDGVYDARAAVVLMDAWYPRLIEKVLPQLVEHDGFVGQGRYDAPRAQGSAYQDGWFQHMTRVLEMALGESATPYRRLKCGDGTLTDCRRLVLEALDLAVADLGGVENMASWDGSQLPNAKHSEGAVVEDYDAVEHTAISLYKVPPIHWVNRPTFQQVVEVGGGD
ncbi:MAG TPA: penicillin acylase family protein [Nevskiaceae bacterium]|nr:penicillin acylase family protein [Nevskiaceae bacterium]